jgi:hypothetical protein
MMLTKEEFATEGNWSSVDVQNLKFAHKFKIQSFKTLKNFLEEENEDENLKIIDQYKNNNFKIDLLKTIVAYIEWLMKENRFDEMLNLVKYIEEESNKSIKICYVVTRLYVIKK